MRIAIIGAGGIAQKAYFPLLVKWPGLEIGMLCTRTQATLEQAAQRWGIPHTTTNLRQVIVLHPQAAFVLSPTASHYAICKDLLENDIDVFVEKPLTDNSATALALARLAEERKRILMVAFNRRYAPLYQQARQILADLPIQSLLVQKHRVDGEKPSLFEQYLDDTIHQIDLMRFFCGDLQALSTHYTKSAQGTISNAASLARLPAGGLATLVNSLRAGGWQESLSLHAEGLSLHVDAFRELRVRKSDHEVVYGCDRPGSWMPDLRERGFEGEIEHFLDCVATRQTPMTNGMEAVKTQQFMEALVCASGDPLELSPA